MRMSKMGRIEYLEAVKSRYLNGTREEKELLLNEAEKVTGMHRKSIIRFFWRVVNNKVQQRVLRKRGPKSRYDYDEFKLALGELWLESGKMCSRNLKAALPEWLPSFEKLNGVKISARVKQDLLSVSHASMDRIIHPYRRKFGRGKCGTKPGTILRTSIPIRAESWNVDMPGYFEADTVAHCGESLAGEFVWTLTLTDIFSQWTEIRPVWHKGSLEILNALRDIEANIAFPILAFDCDNGSEFINYPMIEYFGHREKVVKFTRSRPYKKNDQAHVEQKNWSYARQLLHYERIDNKQTLQALQQICRDYSLLKNHFYPNKKLIRKERVNSRKVKTYEFPKTPYQRLLESTHILEQQKEKLKQIHLSLDPCSLRRRIYSELNKLKLSVTRNCEASYLKQAKTR
jgi:hypothetical protein